MNRLLAYVAAWTCAGILLGLAGCRDENPSLDPAHDLTPTAVTTPSVEGPIVAMVGGSQTFSISFAAKTGYALSALQVTNLHALPPEWQGPNAFNCDRVDAGCVLTLTYSPHVAGRGSLLLHYSYRDGSRLIKSAVMTVDYASTTANNVVATASTSGQIAAVVGGGARAVLVNFTTDDGNPATLLSLDTNLAALPAGWSSSDSSFTCDQVSTGNGCQLMLSFSPSAASTGALTLSYSYVNSAGSRERSSLTLPYTSTTDNNVVATAAPSGQVNAVVGAGHTPVGIVFTTDDGNPAHDLRISSDLNALPADWRSAVDTFECNLVSTGNGCMLSLEFAPTAATSGALTLQYSYRDNSATDKTGSLTLPFRATTHNNVIATRSPAGQITAVAGAGSQSVAVTFTTDDGNPATALHLTSLDTLPAGWSSSSNDFSCATLSNGSSCQLSLTYAPTAADQGTLNLGFTFTDNSGAARAGTTSIAYVGTSHNNVIANLNPSAVDAIVGVSQAWTLTFTTDDGAAATDLRVDGLASLPSGWSTSASSFDCLAVSTGADCQLGLTYSAQVPDTGTLTLAYSYRDNAGQSNNGTFSVNYSARRQSYLYVADYSSAVVACPLLPMAAWANVSERATECPPRWISRSMAIALTWATWVGIP